MKKYNAPSTIVYEVPVESYMQAGSVQTLSVRGSYGSGEQLGNGRRGWSNGGSESRGWGDTNE